MDSDSNDDLSVNNPLPSHLQSQNYQHKNTKGWAGDEMEMQHQMQQLSNNNSAIINSNAAVDLNQFRNEEVGIGYQAKGVIRQRNGYESGGTGGTGLKIIDMTKKAEINDEKEDESSRRRKKSKKREKKKSKKRKRKNDNGDSSSEYDSDGHDKDTKDKKKSKKKNKRDGIDKHAKKLDKEEKKATSLLKKYLECEAIRTFRKEIEKIVSEASKKR